MKNYSCSMTQSYKQGFIFSAYIDGKEVIKYTVDKFAYVQYAKSIRAAKIMITKHSKKYGGAYV